VLGLILFKCKESKLKKSKLFFNGLVLAGLMVGMTGCLSPSPVAAGEEAVLTYKPWFFGHGGVDMTPIETGLTWTLWTTSVTRFSIKPQMIDIKFDDLITSDNNPVDFHAHVLIQHIKGSTPILLKNFGGVVHTPAAPGGIRYVWWENNVKEPFRAMVRHFTKSHSMFEMTTNPEITDKMEQLLLKEVRRLVSSKGIPVDIIKVTIGKVTPPQKVIESTIMTAVQKQRRITQEERVKAEQARAKAETASAEADLAYAKTFGMTPDQYLRNKKLENDRTAIKKADKVDVIIGNVTPVKTVGE